MRSNLEIELTFDRMIETQFDVDVFHNVWTENVTGNYTLEEAKEYLSDGLVDFSQILEACLEEDWAEQDMNFYKPFLEYSMTDHYWFSEDDVEGFEKRLKKFLGID